MAGIWDFCPNSTVAQELPPEPQKAVSFNGWEFSSKPAIPYRRSFRLSLTGLRWYLNPTGTALDLLTDPTHNAGRLLKFYRDRQTWDVFNYSHEYLGEITCKFRSPVVIPPAIPDSNGLIGTLEVELIHSNPGY